MTANALLSFTGLGVKYVKGNRLTHAVRNVTLDIGEGEFICIVGPSGCGKTTLLNVAAGLVKPTEGEVRYRGKPIASLNTDLGFVTQSDSLMPWTSVLKNVELALAIRGVGRRQRREQAQAMIERMGLTGFEKHYPNELSGGMRKRVSLARTLVYESPCILFDEPFASLDAHMRMFLQDDLLKVCADDSERTMIFVTHDLSEAVLLADRVIVLGRGVGVVADLQVKLSKPRNVFGVQGDPDFAAAYRDLWEVFAKAGGSEMANALP